MTMYTRPVCLCAQAPSHVQLFVTPWVPLSVEFSRQEFWSGLSFPPPVGLPDGQWHMKRCSSSPIIREMQIKTTMRYHLIIARMTIIKKSTNSKCWRGCGKKGMLLHCWWECKLIQPLEKTVWRFLKKLGIKPP